MVDVCSTASVAAPTGRVPGIRGASSSPVHRALVLVLGDQHSGIVRLSKSSRQCSLPSLLTYSTRNRGACVRSFFLFFFACVSTSYAKYGSLDYIGSQPSGHGIDAKRRRRRREAGLQLAGHAALGGIPVGVPLYRPSGMIAGSHAWPTDVVSATSAYRAGEPSWSEMALATPGGKQW